MNNLPLGLLRFCIEHSDDPANFTASSIDHNRDPEDYKWLMASLDNLKSDTERLKTLIDKLHQLIDQHKQEEEKEVKEDNEVSSTITKEIIFTLEGIQYFVEDYDLAGNVPKFNGCSVLSELLRHSDSRVRSWSAWVIASSTQNHVQTQLAFIKLNTIHSLLLALQHETNNQPKEKYLYALSSLTANNLTVAIIQQNGGIPIIASLLSPSSPSSTSRKVEMKAIWLLYKVLVNNYTSQEIARETTTLAQDLITILTSDDDITKDIKKKSLMVLSAYLHNNQQNIHQCKLLVSSDGDDKLILKKLNNLSQIGLQQDLNNVMDHLFSHHTTTNIHHQQDEEKNENTNTNKQPTETLLLL